MRQDPPNPLRLVVNHRRDMVAIDLPVDGHDGCVLGGGALDGIVLAFNAGEDQPVDSAGEKCGEQILLRS
jgi:hypothetical protein